MINVVGIALLISSLAAAGVWSPPPNAYPHHLIREGHRIIVVEYEREIPQQTPTTTTTTSAAAKDAIEEVKGTSREAGQGTPTPEKTVQKPSHSAKDLVCDAYDSCKEKISNAIRQGRDKISGKASDVEESAKDTAERMRGKASDIKEGVKDAFERAKEKASEIEESAEVFLENTIHGMKHAVNSTAEMTKEAGEDAAGNISHLVEKAAGNISHLVEKAAGNAGEIANVIRGSLTDVVNYTRNIATNYATTLENVRSVAAILHLLAVAVAYGTSVWVTFVSSHVLVTALQRQLFGTVQSKVYPMYFRVMACGVGVATLGHFFERKKMVGIERVQGFNLIAALGLILVNMMYLEPKATKVMFERMKMEKEEGRGRDMADVLGSPISTASTATTTTNATTTTPFTTAIRVTKPMLAADQEVIAKSRIAKLHRKLKKLNGYSSFLNILTLMSLTWHLVHLARRLQMTCK